MALYAYEDDILVYAAEAEEGKVYLCSGCENRVRVRKGRYRLPHFYHLSKAPSCRLYSKSQDHLFAQIAIQKMLPTGEAFLEKPFLKILRVADVVWEPKKIIFEIQCSLLSPQEAERRMHEYGLLGYQVVWILDDRIFNRAHLRSAEQLLRSSSCYFATLRKQVFPIFYDQFEVFLNHRRIKKGGNLRVRLDRPNFIPTVSWPEEKFPQQIHNRVKTTPIYFDGDLIHKALLSEVVPAHAFSMQQLCFLENLATEQEKLTSNPLKKWIHSFLLPLLHDILNYLIEKVDQ